MNEHTVKFCLSDMALDVHYYDRAAFAESRPLIEALAYGVRHAGGTVTVVRSVEQEESL